MSRALSWCLSTLFLIAPLVLMGCVIAPPTEAATRPAASPIKLAQVDTTCRTDADCTVKNVGSCCGASPACVNVNSPTNPKAVAAQCRASGMMGVCGFRPIDACQCVSGQCAATRATTDTLRP